MKVNGQNAEPGCYIAGHHGQYGVDQLAEVCEQFGIEVPEDDDPRYWRRMTDYADDPDFEVRVRDLSELGTKRLSPEDLWDRHIWAGDRCEELLNEHTEGGHWSWEDGEFFLTQTSVERWLFVQGTDYEDAWRQVMEANVNEHCGYTDQYQAVELAEDSDEDDKVFQFRITVEYEPFNHEGQEITERG